MSDTRYSFESKPTRRTLEHAAQMLDKFLARLGVDAALSARLSEDDRRSLIAFTSECHLNIEWYDRSRRQHKRLYWGFVTFTALVVVGLPVAISLTSAASKAFTAQIGVIITGVLSAHRLLASTLEKRNLAHHFWKAQADLKSVLYSFEDAWRHKVLAGDVPIPVPEGATVTLAREFVAALDEATIKAKEIKSEEQALFFARSEGMFSGISDVLGTAYKQGSSVVESMREDARVKGSLRAQVGDMEAVHATLTRQIGELERELEALSSSTSSVDEQRRRSLLATIDGLRKRLLDNEVETSAVRSKLSRL